MNCKFLTLVTTLALSGCASSGSGAAPGAGGGAASDELASAGTVPVGAQCDSVPGQSAIGQALTQSLLDRLRIQSGSASARALKPGQMITMEYEVTRLNVLVDEKNQITAVRCG